VFTVFLFAWMIAKKCGRNTRIAKRLTERIDA
jgi:hypothetical protein